LWYAVIFSYYALLALLIYGKYRRGRTWILVSKTFTSLAFVAVAVLALAENPDAGSYAPGILLGLTLSVGGDVFLVYKERPRAFVGGLSCFLLAHLAYGTVFAILSGIHIWDAVFFVLLVGLGFSVRQFGRIDLHRMAVPVFVYLLAISYMVAQAVSLCITMGLVPLSVMAGLGALLFYLSDAFLAWNTFKRPFNAYNGLNLVTYYTGQLLLALSILYYPG